MSSETVACPAVLALEFMPGEKPPRLTFGRDEADALAAYIADDLRALLPGVAQTRLVLAGALFDAVELLRPRFPVWAALDTLAARAPRADEAHVLAFGAHEGRMPAAALTPDAAYAEAPMRYLPWSLQAPPELAQRLGEAMETELIAKGQAGERTADLAMRLLGVRLEHARYLTRHDLLAITCVQYEHATLAALWELIEVALLSPARRHEAMSARGVTYRYADGAIEAPLPSFERWYAAAGQGIDAGERAYAWAGSLFELRQSAALLAAHHLPLRIGGETPRDGYVIEPLAAARAELGAPTLHAHEAPGLGVVAVSVAQAAPGGTHLLAHGYPLTRAALGALCEALALRYGAAPHLQRLGRIVLDADARALAVPSTAATH
ncbi:hypothetical protein MBSD_n0980 [Mizugakiibacter sediminis]|uniref:Uncharacterized protein n=1 Tax=Mizugakiibacter sediminis TaxID=1475481 RepID=A0A0K8QLG4_9GAMM|nr:hypothetical protein [Mizugakiibacter sediminis]GAP65689.1 hypothetical protein MBSD_n0980 [Mizugakiibacter sediminis]